MSTVQNLREGEIRAKRPAVWFKDDAPEEVSLTLTPPPCFSDQAGYLQSLDALAKDRLTQVRAELRRQGRGFLGWTRVRKTSPTDRPRTEKARLGSNPTFSAMTRGMWLGAVQRLRAFRRAYRTAYKAWRSGDRSVVFPAGTWWIVRCAGAIAATTLGGASVTTWSTMNCMSTRYFSERRLFARIRWFAAFARRYVRVGRDAPAG